MRKSFKRTVANLGLLFVAVLASTLFGEAIVRMFDLHPPGHHKLLTEYDPLLGWRKIRSHTGIHATSEYTITESFNSRGIRGPEYNFEKPLRYRRILILGDSFAEGYTVEFDDLLSQVLQRELNVRLLSYEVINMGTGGYSTDQELLVLRTEGKLYHPDVVILLFVPNDVWFNGQAKYERGHKPVFELKNGGLSLVSTPPPPPPPADPLGTPVAWLNERSKLFALGYNQMYTAAGRRWAAWIGAGSPPAVYRVFSTTADPEVERAWQITRALLIEIAREARSIESEFLVVYVPPKEGVYEWHWDTLRHAYPRASAGWDIHEPARRLMQICRHTNLECIDPTEDFRTKAEQLGSGKPLYFARDAHWTVHGHRVAGRLLASYLRATGGD